MGAHDPRSAQDRSTVHNLCSPGLPFVSDLLISVKNVTNIVKISIIIANFAAKIVVKVVTGDKDCDDGDPLPPQAGWFEEGSPLAAHGSRSKIVFKIVVKFVANPDISV